MLNRNTKQTFILAASLAASALILSGCRSMPGAGMFGMRSEPSVEALGRQRPNGDLPCSTERHRQTGSDCFGGWWNREPVTQNHFNTHRADDDTGRRL